MLRSECSPNLPDVALPSLQPTTFTLVLDRLQDTPPRAIHSTCWTPGTFPTIVASGIDHERWTSNAGEDPATFAADGSSNAVQSLDEWSLEQGFSPYKIPPYGLSVNQEDKSISTPPYLMNKSPQQPDSYKIFAEETPGWRGYIEWEKYPEKKRKAAAILARYRFPPPPEFQLAPVPGTNPVLEGERWVMWHKAVGGALTNIPEKSWSRVVEEKHPDMLHLLRFPYNGEPPKVRSPQLLQLPLKVPLTFVHLKRLVTEEPITPNPLFFVRNHGGIPDISPVDYTLHLGGLLARPTTLKLADLQNEDLFPRQSNVVTIQCSGTRRIEQINEYAGEGDEMINAPWAEGAIGTATWTGVSLKKVVKHCGGLIEGAQHLEFYGADTYFKQVFSLHPLAGLHGGADQSQGQVQNYLVSVPWSKVKANEVILAWEMNGQPLPKIHGSPLRVVVLGYIGARSVKWLYRIKALRDPSPAPVQSREYLYFNSQVGKHNQLYTSGIQIQEMPVSSAIMEPWTKQVVVHNGLIKVKGWAYSGGGRWPERVEVSADGGFLWYEVPPKNLSKKHKFAWRTWHMELPLDAEGWTELVVRCWDNSLNTQPTFVRSAWNWGLHVTSSCHRIKVFSVNKSHELTRTRLQEFERHRVPFMPITNPTEFRVQSDKDVEKYWAEHDPRDVVD